MENYVSKPATASVAPRVDQLFTGYSVRSVSPSAIGKWLKLGWHDIKANPSASLAYGIIFSLVGMLMSITSAANPAFLMAATTGFFLVGPFLALGLYSLSRQIEQGEPPRFFTSLTKLKQNALGLGLYAIVLGLMMVFWVRLSALIVSLFAAQKTVAMEGYSGLWNALLTIDNSWLFILAFFGVGFLFALIAFVSGVVTAPLLLDRRVDIVTAATTSFKAVLKNPVTMFLWALVITLIIGLGILSFDLGLIIAMPLIAHASWHAYRDLVNVDTTA